MTTQQKFFLGVAAGAAGMLAATRVVRGRRAISFAGRNVVITGGSRGLGLVMARQLAVEGARLCLLARDVAATATAPAARAAPKWAPSPVTALNDRAAVINNQL